MPEIKNKSYMKFLDTGLIDIFKKEDFDKLLGHIHHQYYRQARALMIFLYYTGRRPAEILELTSDAFKKDRRYLQIVVSTKKKVLFVNIN